MNKDRQYVRCTYAYNADHNEWCIEDAVEGTRFCRYHLNELRSGAYLAQAVDL
jgi:hypothetical protein